MAETMRISGVVLAAGRSTRMGRDKALLPADAVDAAEAEHGAEVNAISGVRDVRDRRGTGEVPESRSVGRRVMWERQRDVLRAAGIAEIFLSARPEQQWTRDAMRRSGVGAEEGAFAAVLHDALPGCGPLVGITAALERAVTASHVAVLAIDLPRIEATWFGALREMCGSGVGAVGRRGAADEAGERGRGGRGVKGSGSGGRFFEPLAAIYPREFMWLAWEALARGEYALQRVVGRAVEAGVLGVREIAPGEAGWFENVNSAPRSE